MFTRTTVECLSSVILIFLVLLGPAMVPALVHAAGIWTGEGGVNDLTNASNWSSFKTPGGTGEANDERGMVFNSSSPVTAAPLWAGQGWTIPGGLYLRGGAPSSTIAADTVTWNTSANSYLEMAPDCTTSQTFAVGGYWQNGAGYVVNNSPGVLNFNVNYAEGFFADGTGNIVLGTSSIGPGTNRWELVNGSISAGGAASYYKLGTGQVTLNNPNGLSDGGFSTFNFYCGTTAAQQRGTGAGTPNTPLGTGSVNLYAGTLNFAPQSNGANIFLLGGAGGGQTFTYGLVGGNDVGGAVLGLDKGKNASLFYFFNGNFVRSGAPGTLVMVPSAKANLGVSEIFLPTGGAGIATTNNIVDPSIVVQASKSDSSGSFAGYGLGGLAGFCDATVPANPNYVAYNVPGGNYNPVPNEISDITANSIMPAAATTYALRVAAGLTLNNPLTIRSGGLILNGQSITNGGGALIFQNPADVEARIYAGTATASAINCPIWRASALTKFGFGVLVLGAANTYIGPTYVNQGSLQLGTPAALPPGQNVYVEGSTSVLDLNGQNIAVNLGPVYMDGFARIVDSSAVGGGVLHSTNYVLGAGTVGSGNPVADIQLADPLGGAGAQVTVNPSSATSYTPTATVLRGQNTYTGGTTIWLGGILNVAADVNLGAFGTTVTINNGGTFQLGSNNDFSTLHVLRFNGANSIIDTNGFTATFASPVGGGGAGGLAKAGKGTLKLTANNTYTGNTTITGGVLEIANNLNFGPAGATKLIFSQEAIQRHDGLTPVLRLDAAFDVSSFRQICLDNDGAIDTNGNNVNFGGAITDDGGGTYFGQLIKQGAGTLKLSGANVFGGGVWVQKGTVQVNNLQALGTSRVIGGVAYFPQVTLDSGATLDLNTFGPVVGGIRGSGLITDSSLVAGNDWIDNIIPDAATLRTFSGVLGTAAGGRTITYQQGGNGTQVFSGVNTYTGITSFIGGVLRADLGVGLPGTVAGGPNNNLQIAGGAWETQNDINLTLGGAPGQVQLPWGNSGFSAYGPSTAAPLKVNLNAGAPLIWGVTPAFTPAALVLQGPWANRPLSFNNDIDLNGAARTIIVNADPASPYTSPNQSPLYTNVVPATISGKLFDSIGGAGLTKSGPGILVLSNPNNNYAGQTTVAGGVLRAIDAVGLPAVPGATLPAATNLNLTGGVFETTGQFVRTIGGGPAQVSLNGAGNTIGFSAYGTTSGGATIGVGLVGGALTPLFWGANLNAAVLRLNDISANEKLLFLNSIALNGANREINVRALCADSTAATISGQITGAAGERLTKSGQGLLVLPDATAAAAIPNNYNGQTVVTGGVLRASDQTTNPLGGLCPGNLQLKGGVLETGWDFVRPLGTLPGQVQLYAEPPTPIGGANTGLQYPSGFSARDPVSGNLNAGAMTVAIGGTAMPTNLTWDPAGSFCPNPLILNAATANAPIYFLNPIDLNNMPREIDVNSPTYPAYMKGALTGGGGLVKGGPGTLIFDPAVNTYLGDTTVLGGALRADDGITLPIAGCLTLNNAVWQSSNDMVRTGGSLGGQMQITGGTSGFSNTGTTGSVNVAFGTAIAPTGLTWGAAHFQPDALVLNDAAATGPLAFENSIDLNGSVRTVIVASSTATMSGQLTGPAGGLSKTGEGTLVLSGTHNTFMGGTIVDEGTLILTNSGALADGSSLTVGDASAFPAPIVPRTEMIEQPLAASPQANPVPEPSTLALLAAVATLVAIQARRRRR